MGEAKMIAWRYVLVLSTLLGCLETLHWHTECLCEVSEGSEHLSLHWLYKTENYLKNGKIHKFCECGVETVQQLNENHILPVLNPLLVTPFFRYFRCNLFAECSFWKEDGYCVIQGIPFLNAYDGLDCSVADATDPEQRLLSAVDLELNRDVLHENWPSELDNSWTSENESNPESLHYVNLVLNKERFTGYMGNSSRRIWSEIYKYNCFHDSLTRNDSEETEESLQQMKVEHRVFYRIISGLHASITAHICHEYLLNRLDQFEQRLGQHPERLNNLVFTYLLVLRAVNVSGDFLLHYRIATGNEKEDEIALDLIKRLFSSASQWPLTYFLRFMASDHFRFDETIVFAGKDKEKLEEEFRQHFYNISRIMDCVGCERCRLWGKLQVLGIGTALRILYAPDRDIVFKSLERNHIVALLNTLGRLGHSLRTMKMLQPLINHHEGVQQNVARSIFETNSH